MQRKIYEKLKNGKIDVLYAIISTVKIKEWNEEIWK